MVFEVRQENETPHKPSAATAQALRQITKIILEN